MVAVSEAMYILFVPGFTILAFLVGTGLAIVAMSSRQDPAGDEPATEEPEAAH